MNRIDLTLPGKWSDLKQRQIEGVAKLFLRNGEKKDLLAGCFMLLSGWRIVQWKSFISEGEQYFCFKKKGTPGFYITASLFASLVKELEWISNGFYLPSYVPVIKGFKTPNLMLYGISLEQYLMTDRFYVLFIRSGNYRNLDRMLSAIYSVNFKGLDIEKEAGKMAKKPKHIKFAAFIWFTGTKMWIREKYPFIYGHEDEMDIKGYPDESILRLLSSLNGGDITNNERILKIPVHEAFFELNRKIENSISKKNV